MSRLSRETICPAITLRALSPTGFAIARRMSPARIPTRRWEPCSARIKGVSRSTKAPAGMAGNRQVIVLLETPLIRTEQGSHLRSEEHTSELQSPDHLV